MKECYVHSLGENNDSSCIFPLGCWSIIPSHLSRRQWTIFRYAVLYIGFETRSLTGDATKYLYNLGFYLSISFSKSFSPITAYPWTLSSMFSPVYVIIWNLWFRLPACVIHCFTGTKEEATVYLEMGCYIGLTGKLDVNL